MHTLATLLVFADLLSNATKTEKVIVAFAVTAVIGFMALAVLKSDHRGAWMAVPLVIVILILATQGGVSALRNGGLQVWHLFFS
jgi:hypothetical protein